MKARVAAAILFKPLQKDMLTVEKFINALLIRISHTRKEGRSNRFF